MRCSRLAGPSVVLLGDAGHAVTPNLGQGCNSSLEDVGIFHKVTSLWRKAAHAWVLPSERPSRSLASQSYAEPMKRFGRCNVLHSASALPCMTLGGCGIDNSTSQVLEKHLSAGDAGIQAALEEYSSGRLADVHALAYLDAISQHVRSDTLPNDRCFRRRGIASGQVIDGAAGRHALRPSMLPLDQQTAPHYSSPRRRQAGWHRQHRGMWQVSWPRRAAYRQDGCVQQFRQ